MATATVPSLIGLRLLVIEDEYMVAEHIGMTLEDFGCALAGPVGTMDEALVLIRAGDLDGVLLDANLDGESSMPLAATLLASSVPFVVVTGYGACELPGEALNQAPRLTKPFSTAELERTLIAVFCAKRKG